MREPIGTGPYKIDYWDHGQRLVLRRNDTYWGTEPEFARADYQWRSEGSVRAAMVTNDEADIATSLGPEDGAGDLGVAFPNNETTALRMHGHRTAAGRHPGAPGHQLCRQPDRHRQGTVPGAG